MSKRKVAIDAENGTLFKNQVEASIVDSGFFSVSGVAGKCGIARNGRTQAMLVASRFICQSTTPSFTDADMEFQLDRDNAK